MVATVETTGRAVPAVHRPTVGGPIGGPVHDAGDHLRGRVHHGQLHRPPGLFHHHDIDYAQLRHVLDLSAGHVDAGVRGRVRGGQRVVRRAHMHRGSDTRKPVLVVRAGPPRRRRVLAKSAPHHSARTADAPGRRQRQDDKCRDAVQRVRPAARTGRLQADGHNDVVFVFPAVQRVVRAHCVHDTTVGQPARVCEQLSGDAAGGARQYPGHDPVVGAVDPVRVQTAFVHIVHRLLRVVVIVGRLPDVGRQRRIPHQRGRHLVYPVQHGHERARAQIYTVRHARRSVPERCRRRRRFHCRLLVVHI